MRAGHVDGWCGSGSGRVVVERSSVGMNDGGVITCKRRLCSVVVVVLRVSGMRVLTRLVSVVGVGVICVVVISHPCFESGNPSLHCSCLIPALRAVMVE